MKILKKQKEITCIIPKGDAEMLSELLKDRGVIAVNITNGRGSGVVESFHYDSWVEVSIITVIVSAEEADSVFNYLYNIAEIGVENKGFMYQGALSMATEFVLPEIPEED